MAKSNEDHHQKKTVALLRDLQLHNIIVTFFAVENENKHSKGTKKDVILEQHSKAMGKLVGVSDIIIIGFDMVHPLEIKDAPRQLKTKKSVSHTKVSPEQRDFLATIEKSNVCEGAVAYGYNQAKKIIGDWFCCHELIYELERVNNEI